MHEHIQPIVLVGGRSRRFGRDKLREPLGRTDSSKELLVDRPIAALRGVFGPRVAAVGECDPLIRERADLVICDRYPDRGPLGGILSALEGTGGDVFVLPGDVPKIEAGPIESIVAAAEQSSHAWAVLAMTTQVEPCIGVYRRAALSTLRERIDSNERLSLHDALPSEHVLLVAVDARWTHNVNTVLDLASRDNAVNRGTISIRPRSSMNQSSL